MGLWCQAMHVPTGTPPKIVGCNDLGSTPSVVSIGYFYYLIYFFFLSSATRWSTFSSKLTTFAIWNTWNGSWTDLSVQGNTISYKCLSTQNCSDVSSYHIFMGTSLIFCVSVISKCLTLASYPCLCCMHKYTLWSRDVYMNILDDTSIKYQPIVHFTSPVRSPSFAQP